MTIITGDKCSGLDLSQLYGSKGARVLGQVGKKKKEISELGPKYVRREKWPGFCVNWDSPGPVEDGVIMVGPVRSHRRHI